MTVYVLLDLPLRFQRDLGFGVDIKMADELDLEGLEYLDGPFC